MPPATRPLLESTTESDQRFPSAPVSRRQKAESS